MNRFLKRNDGSVYGPVDLATLQLWVTDGRVAADDQISEDQKTWTPASDATELFMDWNIVLHDGSIYGPVHLLALRDLIQDGTVARHTKIRHKHSGEERMAFEALLFELMKSEARLSAPPSDSSTPLDEAEKKIEKLQQDLQKAASLENKLRDEIKSLAGKPKSVTPPSGEPPALLQDLREQAEKWKKLYQEEQSAANAREAELKRQIREQKGDEDRHNALVQDVEKWKKMYSRAAAEVEQMKGRQVADQPAAGDRVPRSQLEDVERKLSQIEHNYQQLLKTLNRRLGVRSSVQPPSQADNLQRRDVN